MEGYGTRKRLYYYTCMKFGLLALQRRRLRVSRIDNLNDTFEFLAPIGDERQRRLALRDLKHDMGQKKGILCFSESRKSPAMWAHYADTYEGLCLCLGFDVTVNSPEGNALVRKIQYVSQRLAWPQRLDEKFANDLLFTKFEHWRYEQEWRAFLTLADCEHCCGHYFKPFSDDLILREVYIGEKSRRDWKHVQSAIEGLRKVRIHVTRPAHSTFEVVQDKSVRLA